ncbi:hypothetical protein [Methanimicrococcus stummii]|uniref:hypothetical protein n=1 Tax=Methanimicrococcus stummii TaxID=3028294 RepID=UPI00292F77D9|nr:hypothetical protein [Methanimicrococcus sp. Es2]
MSEKIDGELLQTSEFSNVSDVINVAAAEFVGQLSIYENDPFFDYSMIHQLIAETDSETKNISVSLSFYLFNKLEHLSKMTKLKRSVIIRIALNEFFKRYDHSLSSASETHNIEDVKKEYLKSLIKDVLNEMKSEL